MADRESEVVAKLASGVSGLNQAAWDRIVGNDPFLSHAFLAALEISGSVGKGTGWTPATLLVEDSESHLISAAPAYLKTHSQGEYVFDHAWADAFERAGGSYFPKLQVCVPFTPVPGPRLLGKQPQHLLAAVEAVAVQNEISSAHITFIDDAGAAECERRGWLIREGVQYHWFNRGYADFDAFLGALTSRKRKAIRKEREAASQGVEIRALRGAEIGPAEWDAMWRFYQDTGSRKWGHPYLTRRFFDLIAERMGDALLLFLALRDDEPIAGALNLVGSDTLYGRYWGTTEEAPFLHFELCYYQAIEWAIANGLDSVQAGAQGEHKLARGYEPVITRSAHFIVDPGFRHAIERFLEEERRAVAAEVEWLKRALPYKSSSA
ncbi:GNAT family N-acetyltransferase [Sphingomonas daechungensis]|uniref:GNAT family N-acetyltransferase n=1 Tax=Sphingomonas daechungensis TaxID=1176646 RepID=UPI0031E69B2D